MPGPFEAGLDIRVASSEEDKANVLRLREQVYVQEQGRLESAAELLHGFGKFEAFSTYLVAYADDVAVATIKVTVDSDAGLPCEVGVSLTALRREGTLVEIGHCITVPDLRWKGVGIALMREAVLYSAREHQATHVLVDFFVDEKSDAKEKFHALMGFKRVGEPYRDPRFNESPLSIVAVLKVADAFKRYERTDAIKRMRKRPTPPVPR